MKNLLTCFLTVVVLTAAIFAQGDAKNNAAQTGGDLISLLPASEAAATVNLKRLLNEAMPQILAGKPDELAKMNAGIDDIKAKTGIDLRQFEQAAVGMNFKKVGTQFQGEPVVLMRGSFNSAALIAVGKVALNGKFRQEAIGGKNVLIFTLPAAPLTPAIKTKSGIDKFFDNLTTGELAVVSLDANTFALGKVAPIRTMLGATAKNRVSADLVALVNRNQNSIVSFAGNVPANFNLNFGMGDDQIGKAIKSLRQIFGGFNFDDGSAVLSLAARTAQDAQAQEIEEMLLGFQMLGKNILGGKTGDKNEIIARAVENVKITRAANEVQLNAILPQADLNIIIK